MKKVLFKKWIPKQVTQREGSAFQSPVPGTGCYESDFMHEGEFITWGIDTDDNGGSYTIALLLQEDGTVEKALVENIRFITKSNKSREVLVMFKVNKEKEVADFKHFEGPITDEEIVEYFEENYGTVYNWWRI